MSYWKAKQEEGEKKGRPRERWMDDVELDLKNMGGKRWRSRAFDRRELTSVVREVKAKLKRAIMLNKKILKHRHYGLVTILLYFVHVSEPSVPKSGRLWTATLTALAGLLSDLS
jgi:hypothetical protein